MGVFPSRHPQMSMSEKNSAVKDRKSYFKPHPQATSPELWIHGVDKV